MQKFREGRTHTALLESADRLGNNDFSFIALGARDIIEVREGMYRGKAVKDPLVPFDSFIGQTSSERGRLSMGYIGFLSYEATRFFEPIALSPDPHVPDALFFLPEVILRIDHLQRTVEIIAHEDTKEDIDALEQIVMQSPFFNDEKEKEFGTIALPAKEDIESYRTISSADYIAQVETLKEAIRAGETFQVVLGEELRFPTTIDPLSVYRELRSINPSPYMYYFHTPELTIVGASPETLLRVEGTSLLYRPIAGTRKRTGDPDIDAAMQAELLADPKERCEHQMLVDLGRNDLGRIAEIGSVHVERAFRIEAFAHVYHLVSDVLATLRRGKTSLDALRSVFPAGTLTGAPKLRAMELIHTLEKRPRGIYGGAFGYIDSSGNIDLAITIRTLTFQQGYASIRASAGIVKDSVPTHEENECLHKMRSPFLALKKAIEHSQHAV